MPFKSEKQRKHLWSEHPEIAERWTEEYGSKPVPKKQKPRSKKSKKRTNKRKRERRGVHDKEIS
jgi:hypothetical protein